MIYPKDIDGNIKFRAEILDRCKDDDFASLVKEAVYKDILFWFNVFCWAYDPLIVKRKGLHSVEKIRPVVTYPFQDEAILEIKWCIEHGENLFIDKTRDMLATYMVLYTYQWMWLTKPNEEFRIGSRTESVVDIPGDMGTHFEKLRFNLDLQPDFLMPVGWNVKKHSTYMKLKNPENRSLIAGEATNANFARGDRKISVLFDEFQTWEKAEAAWHSASDSTNCKIALGTPDGAGNKFAELSRTDEVSHKLHLMWYKHPEKAFTSEAYLEKIRQEKINIGGRDIRLGNQDQCPSGCYIDSSGKIRSQWYDEEELRRDPKDMAENVDCSYLSSGDPVFDTIKCEENRLRSKPSLSTGDFVWKVAPTFDSYGWCQNQDKLEVEFFENVNGYIRIWKRPEQGYTDRYSLSADVSEGLEQGDYDSGSVVDRLEKPEVVATIHGKMPTFTYAEKLVQLAVFYGRCIIAPERNNTMGGAVLEQIFKMYNRVYHKEIFTKGYAERTDKLGWETTGRTKGQIISNLSKAISQGEFVDPDERFWKETLTFIKNDGKLEAQGKSQGQKCFDDRVMDRAINLWVDQQLPPPKKIVVKEKLEGWRKSFEKKEGSMVGWVV